MTKIFNGFEKLNFGDTVMLVGSTIDQTTAKFKVAVVSPYGTYIDSDSKTYYADEWSLVEIIVSEKYTSPTLVGVYESHMYPVSDGCSPYQLDENGNWTCRGVDADISGVLPLSLLQPRAETAQEVLDYIRRQPMDERWSRTAAAVGKEFGIPL